MGPQLRKYIIFGGITIAVSSLIAGLYVYYKQQVKLALQYCYKISKINLFHIRKDSFSFEIFIKVQNKSNFTLQINGYDLDVLVNDRKVANVKSDKQYKIYSNGISEISFQVDFDPSKIFDKTYLVNLISYALADQSKIVLSITGYLSIAMDFIKIKKLKFDYKTNIQQIVNAKPDANVKCDIA
jgi:LEA14-like dessication related protein